MGILITSCSELITYIFQNLEIRNLHHQFLRCYDSTKLSQRIQNLFLLVQLFVSLSFYLSERVCEVDPPCYVTADVFTVKNRKYSSSCYNVTSVAIVKVCNFFCLLSKFLWSKSNSCWCCSCDHWCPYEALEWNILMSTYYYSRTSYALWKC